MTKNYRIVWLVLSFELSKFNFFWVQNVWNSYAKSTYISVLNSMPGLGTKHLFGGQQTRDEAKAPMHRRHALLGFFLVFFSFSHCPYFDINVLLRITIFRTLSICMRRYFSRDQLFQFTSNVKRTTVSMIVLSIIATTYSLQRGLLSTYRCMVYCENSSVRRRDRQY